MSRGFWKARLFLGCAGILLASALRAQSPIGDPFVANSRAPNENSFQAQTMLADGDLLVAWEHFLSLDEGPLEIQARRFSLHHAPGDIMTLAQGAIGDDGLFNPLVASRAENGFLLTFIRFVDGNFVGCRAIPFNNEGQALGSEIGFAPAGGCGEGLVALADGTFATSWIEESSPASNQLRVYRKFGRLSSLGELISQPLRINPQPLQSSQTDGIGFLAGNAAGDMTLVWGDSEFHQRARSFSAYSRALPPPFHVAFTDFETGPAAVAVLPNGNRIFAGLNNSLGDSNYVAYQRFGSDGRPLGKMRPAQTLDHALFGDPVLAADRFGNFVIAWGSQPSIFCDRVQVRLFRADGTPVAKELFASEVNHCEGGPQVSFGNDGTFALSWIDVSGVNVAWFSASPGDEPCLARGGRLLCDTGRTGGEPEIDQPDAPGAFDALFLADFDGDGRADPCFHSGTTFSCDLGHRGRGPQVSADFGEPSDTPLMGDVDGDGRADVCVRRGDLLACDTKHDGTIGFQEQFGSAGDIPLLGDVDGDGRADLCLFHDGLFSCDLSHRGGAPDLVISFGRAGDIPVLGDFDGDGRADPCVLRGSTLRCDTRHNGGTAESILQLAVQPGDGIVMGNLDGL
jgi:hypothetical protein